MPLTRKLIYTHIQSMMDLIYKPISQTMELVEKALRDRILSNSDIHHDAIKYLAYGDGKKLRAVISVLSSKLCGYENSDAVDIASAIELLHIASLVHDDIMDCATIRRGKPSINGKWGDKTAVIIGDYLWHIALSILTDHKNSEFRNTAMNCVRMIIQGELLEIKNQGNIHIDENEYIKTIRWKTAELFSFAAISGAMTSACKDPTLAASLSKYGVAVGEEFQIVDDILDYTSSNEEFGKPFLQDMKCGRPTYPLIAALKNMTDIEREVVESAFGSMNANMDVLKDAVGIIIKCGGIEAANQAARNISKQAKNALATLTNSPAKEALLSIPPYILNHAKIS